MAMKKQNTERKVYVTIRSARKPVRFETWRYWEIFGELIFMGMDRSEANDAAKWCGRGAKPGDKKDIANGITLHITSESEAEGNG